MGLIIAVIGCALGAPDAVLPDSCLLRAVNAMEACRTDIPGMLEPGVCLWNPCGVVLMGGAGTQGSEAQPLGWN